MIADETTEIQAAPASELLDHIWSVVSFDRCEASNLTYPEAEQKLEELLAKNVYGLCIVTDNAAQKVG